MNENLGTYLKATGAYRCNPMDEDKEEQSDPDAGGRKNDGVSPGGLGKGRNEPTFVWGMRASNTGASLSVLHHQHWEPRFSEPAFVFGVKCCISHVGKM